MGAVELSWHDMCRYESQLAPRLLVSLAMTVARIVMGSRLMQLSRPPGHIVRLIVCLCYMQLTCCNLGMVHSNGRQDPITFVRASSS